MISRLELGNKPPYAFKEGDLVQVTRLGLARQKTVYPSNHKTEDTKGKFKSYAGHVHRKPAHLLCRVVWFKADYPYEFEQVVRLDYIEPLGTPR